MKLRNIFSRKAPSLDEQLEILSRSGIRLNQGASRERLASSLGAFGPGTPTYEHLLIALDGGMDSEDGPPLSNDILYLDTECIYDTGDYARIVDRLALLTNGEIRVKDLKDFVDVENRIAWIEFVIDERKIHWDMKVTEDWVDSSVFSKMNDLLGAKKANRRYTWFDLGGQDCLIGCCTDAQMETLKRATRLKVDWLKAERTG